MIATVNRIASWLLVVVLIYAVICSFLYGMVREVVIRDAPAPARPPLTRGISVRPVTPGARTASAEARAFTVQRWPAPRMAFRGLHG